MNNLEGPAGKRQRRTVELSERDAREAARLLKLLTENGLDDLFEAAKPLAHAVAPADEELIAKAKEIFFARKSRSRHFNRAMFDEPAWDMLLALYLAEHRGARLTITRLADWIETPQTTALRWIDYLEKQHLVARQRHPNDKRVTFLRLLDKGREALDAYLAELVGASEAGCQHDRQRP